MVGNLYASDVDVYNFTKTPDTELNDLMSEYTALSHHLHYHVVDPQERPDLAKQYGIESMGQAVVVSGTRSEKLDTKDESDITGAILKVTRDTVKTLCFIEGHSEKSTSSTEATGYSTVAKELEREGYKTQSVNLVTSGSVPPDCSVLVDAGPVQSLLPPEVTMLQQFLTNGGKALLLLDPQTDPKLEPVLSDWNISSPNMIVVDASGMGKYVGLGPAAPIVVDYGQSPITKSFSRAITFFPLARPAFTADKTKTEITNVDLLKTSEASFATKEIKGKQVSFNPATDLRGPITLGVTADHKVGDKDGRLVVIGDSDFASNQWVTLVRNGDLFYNIINWLAQDENLISIRPKSPENRRVTLTEAEQRALAWFSVVLLPGLVILTGIWILWKRR